MAFSLATLLPTFSWGDTAVKHAVLHNYKDGRLTTALENGVKLSATPEISYGVTVTGACDGREECNNTMEPATNFAVVTRCSDRMDVDNLSNVLTKVGESYACGPGESLNVWLKPRKANNSTTYVHVEFGFKFQGKVDASSLELFAVDAGDAGEFLLTPAERALVQAERVVEQATREHKRAGRLLEQANQKYEQAKLGLESETAFILREQEQKQQLQDQLQQQQVENERLQKQLQQQKEQQQRKSSWVPWMN